MNQGRRYIIVSFFGVFLAVLLFSCAKKKEEAKTEKVEPVKVEKPTHGLTEEQASKVLFKVGETEVTVGEFADRLAEQSPYLRARYYNDPQRRREFLDNMIQFELLAAEAKKRGYDKSKEVEQVRKQKMVQQMMQELFDKEGGGLSEVSEAEVKEYYEKHNDEFHKPAQVRANHILIRDKAKAQSVLKKVLAKPGDMQYFRKLAEEVSEDKENASRGGDLRFFSSPKDKRPDEPNVPDKVREAAFSLEKNGDVLPSLIESESGFHIIMLAAKRNAYDRTLEDARRMIQNRLWRTRRDDGINKLVSELRAKANIEQNLALLEQVKIEASGAERDSRFPGPGPRADMALSTKSADKQRASD
ncbi:MAG: peptidyl-prolyl cis-trans isomerase [Deltaproteobacteria bacterium]|nr:peptidyl-prolyl cis-trans isomerase [Deltaproteobacteria bacterium]